MLTFLFNKELVISFLTFKVLTVCFLLGFFYYFDFFHSFNIWNRWYSGKNILDAFYLPFSNWDAQHYLLLSEKGYHYWEHSHAFFPLYPILISLTRFIFRNIYLSAFILNTILSYIFFVFLYRYTRYHLPKVNALPVILFVFCFPTAFYLTVFYSEALFLFLFFGFLYFYDTKKSYVCLFFAFLLPLCKGQSLFIFVALLLHIFFKLIKKEKKNWHFEFSMISAFTFGIFTYFLFYWVETGSILSGIQAQKTFIFGNHTLNIFNPIHFIQTLIAPIKGIISYTYSLHDRIFMWVMLFFSPLILMAKNRLWTLFYFCLFYPVISMGHGGGSFTRFSLLLAPFIVLSLLHLWPKKKILLWSLCVLFFPIQIYFIFRFSLNLWIG